MTQLFPIIEKASLGDQRNFQWQEIKKTLAYLEVNSPYYKKLFKQDQIFSKAIHSFLDFEQLPVTEKEDLQQYNNDFLSVPQNEVAEFVATSGTLGRPVSIALTHSDLERLAYNEYLSFQSMGITRQDRVQLLLTLDKQFMAGIAYYSGLRKLGAAVIRSGPGQCERQWELIKEFNITALVAVPSFLIKMLECVPSQLPPSLKKVLAIGEPIRDENGKRTALNKKIEKEMGVQLFGSYASTEMQTAFTECAYGCGGHHHPELIYIELLDENNRRVAPGDAGELTITSLKVKGMPLLRYKTGDMFKIIEEPCECGRKSIRLSSLLGRKKQMIKYKGTTFYPPALENLLHQVSGIDDYGLQIKKDEWGNDKIQLFVHALSSENLVLEHLQSICRQKLRAVPEISFLSGAEMKQLLFPNNDRKPMRIQDFRGRGLE